MIGKFLILFSFPITGYVISLGVLLATYLCRISNAPKPKGNHDDKDNR